MGGRDPGRLMLYPSIMADGRERRPAVSEEVHSPLVEPAV